MRLHRRSQRRTRPGRTLSSLAAAKLDQVWADDRSKVFRSTRGATLGDAGGERPVMACAVLRLCRPASHGGRIGLVVACGRIDIGVRGRRRPIHHPHLFEILHECSAGNERSLSDRQTPASPIHPKAMSPLIRCTAPRLSSSGAPSAEKVASNVTSVAMAVTAVYLARGAIPGAPACVGRREMCITKARMPELRGLWFRIASRFFPSHRTLLARERAMTLSGH